MERDPLHGLERFELGAYPRVRCTLPGSWRTERLILDEHLLYLCLSGSMTVSAGTQSWILGAGEACQITAGTPFTAGADGGSRLRMARVRWRGTGASTRCWQGLEEIEAVLAVLEQRLLAGDMEASEHRALAILLGAALGRAGGARRLSAGQLARLRSRVAADPAATPRDLARELGLSHDYATRLIRRGLGVAPRRFLLDERLRLAADRLAAGGDWRRVAEDLAWRDPKLFLRQFRAAFGEPPGRWRRRLA